MVGIGPCSSSGGGGSSSDGGGATWLYDSAAKTLVTGNDGTSIDGMCLDGTSADPATPPPYSSAARACDKGTVGSTMPFCDTSKTFEARAADLEARLTVDDIAGVLSMSMPRLETAAG